MPATDDPPHRTHRLHTRDGVSTTLKSQRVSPKDNGGALRLAGGPEPDDEEEAVSGERPFFLNTSASAAAADARRLCVGVCVLSPIYSRRQSTHTFRKCVSVSIGGRGRRKVAHESFSRVVCTKSLFSAIRCVPRAPRRKSCEVFLLMVLLFSSSTLLRLVSGELSQAHSICVEPGTWMRIGLLNATNVNRRTSCRGK